MPSESFTYRPDLRHAALGLMSMKTSIPYNFRHKLRVSALLSFLPSDISLGRAYAAGAFLAAVGAGPQQRFG